MLITLLKVGNMITTSIKEIRKMFFLKECIGYLLFKESFRIAFRLVMKKDKTETYDITSRKTVRHAG